jgi:hypothetical protein
MNSVRPSTVGYADSESLVSLAQGLPNGLGLRLTSQRGNLSRQSLDLDVLDVERHRIFQNGIIIRLWCNYTILSLP